ncbi:MAG: DKNYY domain-containing protein [Maritimibacter sp.]
MSYTVKEGKPCWKGKPIKGVSGGFTDLGGGLARDQSSVYMLGKPVSLDASQFEVLSDLYVRDQSAVYERLATKLKPIKGADPASFHVLGPYHGRDKNAAYAQGKKVKLKKPASPQDFRPLTGSYATDGKLLYHGAAQVQSTQKLAFDWTRAKLRLLEDDNWINRPDAVATDDTHVVHLGWNDNYILENADFSALHQLAFKGLASRYISDGSQVWHEGNLVAGARETAKATGRSLLEDAGTYWIGAKVSPLEGPLAEGPFNSKHHALILSPEGLFDIKRQGDAPVCLARRAPLEDINGPALDAFWGRVLAVMFEVLRETPQGADQIETEAHIEAQVAKAGPVSLRLDRAVLSCEGFRQPVQCWWQLACDVLQARAGAPRGQVVQLRGNWLPQGNDGEAAVLRRFWAEFAAIAGHLWAEGETAEAELLAFVLFDELRLNRAMSGPEAEALASLPMPLLQQIKRGRPRHKIKLTTNLGVARLMLTPDWLGATDPLLRLEALYVLHGTVYDARSPKSLKQEVTQRLETYLETEPLALLRARARCVLATLAHRLDEPLPPGVVAYFQRY